MIFKRIVLISFLCAVVLLSIALLPNNYLNNFGPGDKFEGFTLTDYDGNKHSLSDYTESKAIVIMFIATKCPVSNDYNSRMEEVFNEYKDKDVSFLGINSNKSEDISEIRNHAKDNGLTFTILKDEKNIIADKFEASYTPEIYVLSNDFELLYHGRIDNSRRESEVNTTDLRNALDEILSGKSVSNPETKAFGCTIKRI
ncbi:MAG: thioredoxin family protein [Bacteroidetes bacterium]|nr:thioredoxin family protein [Bacteroidota bacterium]